VRINVQRVNMDYYEARLLADVAVYRGNGERKAGDTASSYVQKDVSKEESTAILSLYSSIVDVFREDGAGSSSGGSTDATFSLVDFTESVLDQARTRLHSTKEELTLLLTLLHKINTDYESLKECLEQLANRHDMEAIHKRITMAMQWLEGARGKLNVVTLELLKDTYLTNAHSLQTLASVKTRLEGVRAEQIKDEERLMATKAAYEALPPQLLAELQALDRRKKYLVGALQNLT
jgi:hypothetical protein